MGGQGLSIVTLLSANCRCHLGGDNTWAPFTPDQSAAALSFFFTFLERHVNEPPSPPKEGHAPNLNTEPGAFADATFDVIVVRFVVRQ